MKLVLMKGYSKKPSGLGELFSNNGTAIYGDEDVQSYSLLNAKKLFILGNVEGIRDLDFGIRKIRKEDFIEMFKSGLSVDVVNRLEGRFLMMLCDPFDYGVQVFSDRFGQFDCYHYINEEKTVISSDLSLFPEPPSNDGYDQVGLAHTLTVYGYRAAKKHTIYKNVNRLGIGEVVLVGSKKANIMQNKYKPINIEDYKDADHERYTDIFLSALKIRGSNKGNVVYLSSGWDSTSILGGLVHEFGAEKVKAVIGRMCYSERAGIINPFEIDRAQKVADYYGVSLDIVEFDYTKEIPDVLDDLKDIMKSNFISSANIFTHGILAKYISKNYCNGESIFCGEISDGAHNLGFSQYATIFHPVVEFREYSDKMASYLYGPNFMKSFLSGEYEKDVIYNLFRDRSSNTIFDQQVSESDFLKKRQLLSSFFLRNQRIPLVSIKNSRQLTKKGCKQYTAEMEAMYLEEAAKNINFKTVYSWYLHLYNSFHWQSSTVATLPLTAQTYGFDIQLPFYDSRLQEFLSAMPERWGRGLDFNPTKYPLKNMLEKRIDYPMHLQMGPHSYLYDVDHSFNHSVEIAHHSAFTPVFRELLSNHPYHEILSSEFFNIELIDSIVDRYVAGEEIVGEDLNILFPLCFLVLIKWY